MFINECPKPLIEYHCEIDNLHIKSLEEQNDIMYNYYLKLSHELRIVYDMFQNDEIEKQELLDFLEKTKEEINEILMY